MKKRKRNRAFWHFFRIQFVLLILVISAVAYYFLGGYAEEVSKLKTEAQKIVRATDEETFRSAETSVVYDKYNSVITTLSGEKVAYYISYDNIPQDFVYAMICTEDRKFFKHNGIDVRAILRAAYAAIRNGEVTEGASTITMQLARNIFLSQDKTWQRKAEEIFMAVELEKKYTKSEIMEFYLNNIYFGNGYYGIQAASIGYFGKTVDELDLSQMVYLCAIPNNPSYYDPYTNSDNTIARRNRMLQNMYDMGVITDGAYSLACEESVSLVHTEKNKYNYVETYIYYCATRALMKKDGFVFQNVFASEDEEDAYDVSYREKYTECNERLFKDGLRIYTSIDMDMQNELQDAVDDRLSSFDETNAEGTYELQGAAVCINNDTGKVNAIVGGRSQTTDEYTLNRAYQSYRQPGSTIKPLIVYTPAFERGYTPESTVVDEPTEDSPANANGTYSGDISITDAVAYSKNTVAYSLFKEVTPKAGLDYLYNMNFNGLSEEDERLISALGGLTRGASCVEMASAYATLENDGVYRTPSCIVKIEDADGNIIVDESEATESKEIYKIKASRMMTETLTKVMEYGTGKDVALEEMTSAGKTGTTNENKDGWFVGYTRYYTTSVWVGYDMPKELEGLTGSAYPGEIWKEFMDEIHEDLEDLDFLPYM
ncbi:MAG: PBP1A family penicillin-binding protein [Lachnospiraceae bacterium]|nr:PBP1A family penicillin-binding protein [Lachnospiraceae bacterium]